MARKSLFDLSDPKVLMFRRDAIEKQNRIRQRWNHLHKDLISVAAKFTREPKNYTAKDCSKALMISGLSSLARDQVMAATHRRTKQINDHLICDRTGGPSEPTMKHVEDDVKDLLKESRVGYLKARMSKIPEKKYNYLETSSWKYGWGLEKTDNKLRGPAYGVVYGVSQPKIRSRPHRDPDYYQNPENEHCCG